MSNDFRYFSCFGIEPRLGLDGASLQEKFYELSRQWHPDRFATRPPAERQRALDNTALLNDAFRVLKDPIQRAEYVLRGEGIEANGQPPAELLQEVLELNLAIEELREGDPSVRPQLESARTSFTAMLESADTQLSSLFAEWDAARSAATLQKIRGVLNRRKYVQNLVRTVNEALG